MKEIFELLLKFDLKGLIFTPTDNGLLKLARYCVVGGIATIADTGSLWVFERFTPLWIAIVFGFVIGLIVNYFLSKMIVFNADTAKVSAKVEFITYGIIGVIGLGFTELIVHLLADIFSMYFIWAKLIAVVIVLMWNYFARKILIYK